jgi:predicted ATPase
VLLDEPEVSLHPELLKLLAGLFQEAAAETSQLFVGTQSDRLLRWLASRKQPGITERECRPRDDKSGKSERPSAKSAELLD